MFTGIIEEVATVLEARPMGSNRQFWIAARCAGELRPEQSVAHNGVCLTVEAARADAYRVTVIAESLSKSALGAWGPGSRVNLERCLSANARLDGHFVQGHVDTTGTVLAVDEHDGSRDVWVSLGAESAALVVPRGSIAVDGISLTVAEVSASADLPSPQLSFKISIIPYTVGHTNIGERVVGDRVNLEFDVLGKYVQRFLELRR